MNYNNEMFYWFLNDYTSEDPKFFTKETTGKIVISEETSPENINSIIEIKDQNGNQIICVNDFNGLDKLKFDLMKFLIGQGLIKFREPSQLEIFKKQKERDLRLIRFVFDLIKGEKRVVGIDEIENIRKSFTDEILKNKGDGKH